MTSVWYAIPSASTERAERCASAWREMGYRVAILIDGDTPEPRGANLVMRVPTYEGYFASVNALSRRLVIEDGAEIVVTGGDDMFPDPHHRADEIARDFRRDFPDLCGVMQPTGDDMPGTDRICGSPWLGREWILRGYDGTGPFHGGYRQFYGDEELRIVATRHDRMLDRPDLVQRHEHWSRGGTPTAYQKANDRHWPIDQALFVERQAARFPGSGVAA